MSAAPCPPFAQQITALSNQSLLNVRCGLSLRIAGCERRGQPVEPVREKLELVREEMRKRGML